MIEFNSALDIPEDFTGICKILNYESISYFKNGVLHREDGPARIYKDGGKFWYINGKRHREDGPASEYGNGDKHWFINGLHHREDGPAIEYKNGDECWYYNGFCYGCNNLYIEAWIAQVEKIRREEFKIFI